MRFRLSRSTVILLAIAALAWTTVTAETFGQRKRRPKPHEYGTIVIDTISTANNIAAVEFTHWFHRSKYTCRLCHVDIGFAMVTGETGITEADNRHGIYCGTCHDGTIAFPLDDCMRCHPGMRTNK